MSDDEHEAFGNWLHELVAEACGFDSTAWVVDTIDRAMRRRKPRTSGTCRLSPGPGIACVATSRLRSVGQRFSRSLIQ